MRGREFRKFLEGIEAADTEHSGEGGAEGGEVGIRGEDQIGAEGVGDELHEEKIVRCAAIDVECGERDFCFERHGVEGVFDLIGDGFEGGAEDVIAGGGGGQSDDGGAGVRRPVRRGEAGESGDEVDAAVVGDGTCGRFGFVGMLNEAELIAKPGDGGGGVGNDSFEAVGGGAVMGPGEGADARGWGVAGRC